MSDLPLTQSLPYEEFPVPGDSLTLRLDVLFPELAEQKRRFDVMVTVPRPDDGEPLVPCALPAGVLGCWSADRAVVSLTVLACRPSGAVAAAEVLVPELATAAGAEVTVKTAAG